MRLTAALLEFETIDSNEVEMLVNGAQLSEITKTRSNKSSGGGLSQNTSIETENKSVPAGSKTAPAT
jgi:hypothetical protein